MAHVPHGMTEVTRDVFWANVRSATQNIHPRSERDHTTWEVVSSRQPWGWTSEGYASPHYPDEPERFALTKVAA
jgi:hypothetical protein